MTPTRSTMGRASFMSSDTTNRIHGSHGALKLNMPIKFIRTCGFLRAQMYTIINMSAGPRKFIVTNGARVWQGNNRGQPVAIGGGVGAIDYVRA